MSERAAAWLMVTLAGCVVVVFLLGVAFDVAEVAGWR